MFKLNVNTYNKAEKHINWVKLVIYKVLLQFTSVVMNAFFCHIIIPKIVRVTKIAFYNSGGQ